MQDPQAHDPVPLFLADRQDAHYLRDEHYPSDEPYHDLPGYQELPEYSFPPARRERRVPRAS